MDYRRFSHYLTHALNNELKPTLLKIRQEVSKEDYPLYHRVIKGCLENRRYIDTLIKHYVKKSGKLLDTEYAYFVISIYLLLFTHKKNYSIVNDVVNEVKKKRTFMAPVFNGVLRNIIRDSKDDFSTVFQGYSDQERFALRHSINDELLDMLVVDYSLDDVKDMFHSFEEMGTYAFCLTNPEHVVNSLKSDGIQATIDHRLPNLLKIIRSYDIDKSHAFIHGELYIQSFGTQAIMSLQEFDQAHNVLDLCASPGGKTIAIANRINGRVLALDKNEYKLQMIRENVSRLHLENVDVAFNDATMYNPAFEGKYDLVIVDVPCSATGIMNKIPDIKANRRKQDVVDLVKTQRKIIDNARKYLSSDGVLLYITCSVLKIENEQNMAYILEKTDLKVCTDLSNMYYNNGIYKSLPHLDKEEGYFAVAFRK